MLTSSRAMPRRLLVVMASVALAAASLTVAASPAFADPTDLYVVGTSDVSDSGLITATSRLTLGFEAAYPQYNLLYTGTGTGNAITTAEAGGAAALVVHAPSLENQFVQAGYSNSPAGDALFWGDFVLLGPASDPAGVAADATSPVKAFEAIAAAGEAGKAQFVSRGSNPGTTVAEHQIWQATTGVPTCNIDESPDGGGAAPTMPADAGTDCTPTTQNQPSWYEINAGAKQAQNIEAANACDYGSATNDCYVLTDRGTYENLVAQGGATAPSNLKILVRNTPASANTTEGQLLVNTFHGYVINPSSVPSGSKTDVTGATDFLNYITSPAGQKIVGQYLNDTPGDPNDPPFLPDAAPSATVKTLPTSVAGGRSLDVSGTLKNVVPGTPALNGVEVQLLATPTSAPDATPQQVATDVTDTSGAFSILYTPVRNMTYTLSSPPFSKVEYPLTPPFSDLLQGMTKTLSTVDVTGTLSGVTAKATKGHLAVSATTLPAHYGPNATLTLLAHPTGPKLKPYANHGTATLKAGADTAHQTFSLPAGKWRYYLKYSNPGYIDAGKTPSAVVTVP